MDFQADGGTEIRPALELALSGQQEFSPLRQIIFLTDGNINNEAELFNVISENLGESRLFTIGIGSAPNSYFMRRAARFGRGSFIHIGDTNEVQEKTTALLTKLETPALINIELFAEHGSKGSSHDNVRELDNIFPEVIPDLYAGEPVTVFFKSKQLPEIINLKGDLGNIEWRTRLPLKTTFHRGIRIAWAREKIASLMDKQHQAGDERQRQLIRDEITETALQHKLVSRYTSMVAIDITPANTSGLLRHEQLKNNLPHGWQTPSPEIMLAQISLPATASNARLYATLALSVFIAGLFLLYWKPFRNHYA
jgi:Ca-activated chloride channel family protein